MIMAYFGGFWPLRSKELTTETRRHGESKKQKNKKWKFCKTQYDFFLVIFIFSFFNLFLRVSVPRQLRPALLYHNASMYLSVVKAFDFKAAGRQPQVKE
jgi:hypothetical protein